MGKIIRELKKVSGRLIFPILISPPLYPPPQKGGNGGGADKILIIKDNSIGDFLLFSGILNFYIRHFGDRVYCLVNDNVEEVAKLYTDNVIVMNDIKYFTSFKYRYGLLTQLRKIGFGTAINSILNSSESRDILNIFKIPATYLYEGSLKRQRLWKNIASIIPAIELFDDRGMYIKVLNHERHYLENILNIKVSDDEIKPFIPLKDKISRTVINKFSLENGRYIVFSLSSGSLKRNYPVNKFIEVIRHLHDNLNIGAIVTGAEKDNSVRLPDFAVDLRGKTSLIETFSIIEHAKLFIGNETGITHASWIMGVPTVMILGGGHFGRFLPMYDNGRVVYKYMDCYGCDWKCRYKDIPVPCIGEVNTADIVKAAERIIK